MKKRLFTIILFSVSIFLVINTLKSFNLNNNDEKFPRLLQGEKFDSRLLNTSIARSNNDSAKENPFTSIYNLSCPAWVSLKRLTWLSGESLDISSAVDLNKNIHLVWNDMTPGNYEIYYKRSTDNGVNWDNAKRILWNDGSSKCPDIAVDLNNILHVVWFDSTPGNNEIYYKKSTDHGSSWGYAERLTWLDGNSKDPSITVDSLNTVHLVWTDSNPGNFDLYYKRSTNGGINWNYAKRILWTSGASYHPKIAIDKSDILHVFWDDDSSGTREIYYKRSLDGGNTWSPGMRLTYLSGVSYFKDCVIDAANNIYIFWSDLTPGNSEIYFKKSTDNGVNWTYAKRITWNSGDSGGANAGFFDGTIHLTWHDNSFGGDSEIYYKQSTDQGNTWSNIQILVYNTGPSLKPNVLIIDSLAKLFVFWEDKTPGVYELFNKEADLVEPFSLRNKDKISK